jgi:hypothetical protein
MIKGVEPDAPLAGLRAPAISNSTHVRRALLYILTAFLLAIPCFWQPHIQADDLSSHLYNAWLVSEVQAGHLPGLYVVPQYTNVLFDHLLSFLMKSGGTMLTERVSVLIAIEIFFWGSFALVSALAGQRNWAIVPFLAILTYGAVFRLGFFNFYLSVGICAWAIALVWQDRSRLRWLAIPLIALAYIAHSLPCLWALGVIVYVLVAHRLRPSRRPWLATAGLAAIAATALYFAKNVPAKWAPGLRIDSLFGTDQTLAFGAKYKIIAASLLCLWMIMLIRRFETPRSLLAGLPLQLWVLSVTLCLAMPNVIWLPIYTAGLTFITIRLSLFCALLFCSVVARMRMNMLEKAASIILVAAFFSLSYVDERALNGIEAKVAQATATLPRGARVISTLRDPRLYVQALEHVVDRPCIGHCYNFANYEPSTGQFRVRAEPGNTFVLANYDDIGDLQHDLFVFDRPGINLYRLFPCAGTNICAAMVKLGEHIEHQQITSVAKLWGD